MAHRHRLGSSATPGCRSSMPTRVCPPRRHAVFLVAHQNGSPIKKQVLERSASRRDGFNSSSEIECADLLNAVEGV